MSNQQICFVVALEHLPISQNVKWEVIVKVYIIHKCQIMKCKASLGYINTNVNFPELI